MSTEKGAGIAIGGAAMGAGAAGIVALAALGAAAVATARLIKSALEAARDAKEKAELEKRQREVSELQEELAAGQRAAATVLENSRTWRLEAKCKALNQRLDRTVQRMASTGLGSIEAPNRRVIPDEATSAELEREITRLEQSLQQQEEALRHAITGALEKHAANQGGIDAIDRLAALPPPPLEKPADLVAYLEESERLQRDQRNAVGVTALRESVHRALETLPDHVSPSTMEEVGRAVSEFSKAEHESAAQTAHRRVIELIQRAQAEARTAEPLRQRLARARALAADLVYSQLPEADQRLLADENAVPGAMDLARLEERLHAAMAADAARIFDQQRRLAMAATLDALQSLGYETSVVDEATWFKNGSMFISRPEWGGYVVRLTPRDGSFVMFAGRYVDKFSSPNAAETLTPEMERFYHLKIDDWCEVHLPRLVEALKQRDIVLNVHEMDSSPNEIQAVTRDEIGAAMAQRIETRIDKRERGVGSGAHTREM